MIKIEDRNKKEVSIAFEGNLETLLGEMELLLKNFKTCLVKNTEDKALADALFARLIKNAVLSDEDTKKRFEVFKKQFEKSIEESDFD